MNHPTPDGEQWSPRSLAGGLVTANRETPFEAEGWSWREAQVNSSRPVEQALVEEREEEEERGGGGRRGGGGSASSDEPPNPRR